MPELRPTRNTLRGRAAHNSISGGEIRRRSKKVRYHDNSRENSGNSKAITREVQRVNRDMRALTREGKKKLKAFENFKMNPEKCDNITCHVYLFHLKLGELMTYFTFVKPLDALHILRNSLPQYWAIELGRIFKKYGPYRSLVTYTQALSDEWEKWDVARKIKKSSLLKTSSRPRFYQRSSVDKLAKTLAERAILLDG